MSNKCLKISDGGNTKNYTIINKTYKEKTDLLENIRLATNKINNDNLDNNTNNNDNNREAISSERISLEIANNNRPKKYKRKNRLKKENENFLDSLKSGSGFKIIPN